MKLLRRLLLLLQALKQGADAVSKNAEPAADEATKTAADQSSSASSFIHNFNEVRAADFVLFKHDAATTSSHSPVSIQPLDSSALRKPHMLSLCKGFVCAVGSCMQLLPFLGPALLLRCDTCLATVSSNTLPTDMRMAASMAAAAAFSLEIRRVPCSH